MRAALMALAVVAAVVVAARFVQPPDAVASGPGPAAVVALDGQADPGPLASGAPSSTPTPGGSASAELQGTDWWSVMAELDARRNATLESADPAGLATFAQPDSPAWLADEALVADLAARGLRPEGLRAQVMAIEQVEPVGAQVQLQIVDARSAYDLVDDQGLIVSQVDQAASARWAIVLAPAGPVDAAAENDADPDLGPDPGWRVVSVELLERAGATP